MNVSSNWKTVRKKFSLNNRENNMELLVHLMKDHFAYSSSSMRLCENEIRYIKSLDTRKCFRSAGYY